MKKVTKGLLLMAIVACSTAWANNALSEENIESIIGQILNGEVRTEETAMALVDSLEVMRDQSDLRDEVSNLSVALVRVMNEEDLRMAVNDLELILDGRFFPTLHEYAHRVWEMIRDVLNNLRERIASLYPGEITEVPVEETVTEEVPAEEVVEETEVTPEETEVTPEEPSELVVE